MPAVSAAREAEAVRSAEGPFLGPVPFSEADRNWFFGRDTDIVRLRSLLRTERIVVLHSPSGAGKTSLIQAGLVPRLREDGFRIFPTVRVGQPPPGRYRDHRRANRYAYSAVHSLESGFADDERFYSGYRSARELLGIPLSTYFEHRSAVYERGTGARLLIFDQFEELFTKSPHDHRARVDFFTDLARVLRDRTVWALFSMREEHVAALDRYKRLLPAQLAARYHLDLLTPGGARKAISGPLEKAGKRVEAEALSPIIEDLAGVESRAPHGWDLDSDGRLDADAAVIDPLHLQLVCVRLWQRLPASVRKIDNRVIRRRYQAARPGTSDLSAVECALLSYYDRTLGQVCARALRARLGEREDGAEEGVERPEVPTAEIDELQRRARFWIDDQLIDRDRYRRQAVAEEDDLLFRSVQALLEDEHILRANVRLGTTWYEIAHDRMVGPIRRSNDDWYDVHQNRFERNARRWRDQGFPRQFEHLTRGELDAEGYGRESVPDAEAGLPDHERRYLDFCRDRNRRKRRQVGFAALTLVASAAGASLSSPFFMAKIQELTARVIRSEGKELAARKNTQLERIFREGMSQRWQLGNHDVALLLAKVAADESESVAAQADRLSWSAFEAEPFSQTVPKQVLGDEAASLAASNGSIYVTGVDAAQAARIDLSARRLVAETPCRQGARAFSEDRSLMAVVEGTDLEILRVENGGCEPVARKTIGGPRFRPRPPVWSPDGRHVAAFLDDDGVAVYRAAAGGPGPVRRIRPQTWDRERRDPAAEHAITAVAFGDGVVAAGDDGGGVQLADLDRPGAKPNGFSVWQQHEYWPYPPPLGHPSARFEDAGVVALAFLPPDAVTVGLDPTIVDEFRAEPGWLCVVHRGGIWTRGGRIFLYALDDPHSQRYELIADKKSALREDILRELGRLDDRPGGERITSARFSDDGRSLVVGGASGTVMRWHLRDLQVGSAVASSLGLWPSPAGDEDGEIDAPVLEAVPAARNVFTGARGEVRSVVVTGDGAHVAAVELDGGVRLWQLQRPPAAYRAQSWQDDSYVYALAFASEDRLITTDNRGHLRAWTVRSAVEADCATHGRANGGPRLCIEPDDTLEIGLAADEQGAVSLDGLDADHERAVSIRSVDVRGELVVVGTGDHIPKVLSSSQPDDVWSLEDLTAKHGHGLWSSAFRPQNPQLAKRYDIATGDGAGRLLLWDLESRSGGTLGRGEPAMALALAGEGKTSLAFHPRGRWLAAATRTGGLQIVDLDGGVCAEAPVSNGGERRPCLAPRPEADRPVEELGASLASSPRTTSGEILALAFSPAGDRLAIAGDGVVIWQFDADRPHGPLVPGSVEPLHPGGPVEALAFHPEDGKVVVATEGSSVLMWRIDSKSASPIKLRSEGTELHSLAFSPRGNLLAAGDGRGRFMVWDMKPARLACRVTFRDLTQQEWKGLDLGGLEWRQICEEPTGG